MTVLYVGNTDESLAKAAVEFDSTAELILPDNIGNLPNLSTAYISIGDHRFADFFSALNFAAELRYVSSESWEHHETKEQTERWLRYFSHRKPVANLPESIKNASLTLTDYRKVNEPQLWIVGDAMAAGVGLEDSQRFGEILSKNLNLQVSYLVTQEASISWCSDQILRSDIRPRDKVVWFLPAVKTLTYYDYQLQTSVKLNYRTNHRLDVQAIDEEEITISNVLHTAVISIESVINTSKPIGYNLLISTPPNNTDDVEHLLLEYLTTCKEFVHCYACEEVYIDTNFNGNGILPGPLQHQQYAELFLQYFNRSN